MLRLDRIINVSKLKLLHHAPGVDVNTVTCLLLVCFIIFLFSLHNKDALHCCCIPYTSKTSCSPLYPHSFRIMVLSNYGTIQRYHDSNYEKPIPLHTFGEELGIIEMESKEWLFQCNHNCEEVKTPSVDANHFFKKQAINRDKLD